jgi:hypothetical protein
MARPEGRWDACHGRNKVRRAARVDEGLDEKQVATALTSFGVKTVDPSTVEFVTSGYVQIAVREGHTVEEAMDELADVDIVRTTQPDFIYRAN